MQFSLTPQTLAQMDNVPLQYTGMALDSLDRMKAADQTGLADLENLNAHNAAMRPMLQEHQGLQNASMAVRIPGEAADAQMRARKNANEELLNPESIKAMREKFGADTLNHHINQLTGMGSLMMAAASQISAAPVGGTMAAKQMFMQAGLGDKWHPEWDNLRPDQLAQRLNQGGQELVMTGNKAQQMLQSQQVKGDYAMRKAELEAASRERIAAENRASREALAQMHLAWKTSFNKQSTDQYLSQLMSKLSVTEDPKLRADISAQIEYVKNILRDTRMQEGVTGRIDSEGKLILTNKRAPVTPPGTDGTTAPALPKDVTKSNW